MKKIEEDTEDEDDEDEENDEGMKIKIFFLQVTQAKENKLENKIK